MCFTLYVRTEYCLNITFRIGCNYLEFIDSYDTGLVSLFEIQEDFVECGLWHLDITYTYPPFRQSVDVERQNTSQRAQRINKAFPYFAPLWFECG